MKTLLIATISLLSLGCSRNSGRIWTKTEISGARESVTDTVEMKFRRYGNAFAVRRPYAIYEARNGHANVSESGWKAVMFVQDPWPESISFKGSACFRKITVYEDRYSKVYVVEYDGKDPFYDSRMTIHVVTENGCTLYVAK
jgi:hypothetical protein